MPMKLRRVSSSIARPKTPPKLNKLVVPTLLILILLLSVLSVILYDPTSYQDFEKHKVLREFMAGRQKRGQPIQRQERIIADTNIKPPRYHMVFSTSCSNQQHWESFVFFYHAHKVNQPGTVTRICSGCNAKQTKDLVEFHQKYIRPMNDNFRLHLTPDFGSLTKKLGVGDKQVYKYMNKPYGLRDWMENVLKMNNETHAEHEEVKSEIVMLLDPDMILLRPLVHDFRNENVIFVQGEGPLVNKSAVVTHGNPIAQQDGYLDSDWMSLNISYITGGKGNIDHLKRKDGPLFYNAGPPYLATVRDMYNIAVKWCDYAPKGMNGEQMSSDQIGVHDESFCISSMFLLLFSI
jgi:hypothetical protein